MHIIFINDSSLNIHSIGQTSTASNSTRPSIRNPFNTGISSPPYSRCTSEQIHATLLSKLKSSLDIRNQEPRLYDRRLTDLTRRIDILNFTLFTPLLALPLSLITILACCITPRNSNLLCNPPPRPPSPRIQTTALSPR